MSLVVDTLVIVLVAVSIGLFFAGMLGLYGALGSHSAKVSKVFENTDEEAVSSTGELAKLAERQIEMFDDGNPDNESVYNDPVFIQLVREKLDIPGFKMKCFFNAPDVSGLKLVQELGDKENLDIWVRPAGTRRPDDPHYKIIDQGNLAHVSKHEFGSDDRRYQTFDYREVNRFRRWFFYTLDLGKYRQDERDFQTSVL